ncbi:MAG TPA: amylo-alpha-1,6-glucosidase [Polyangia bacterium]|jgi:predicted glycogen debranching enzyme
MAEPLRVLSAPFSGDALHTHEWLVTNGLGGYASGTIAGPPTRRYHGLLVAALPAPLGRVMMLNRLSEELRLPDRTRVELDGTKLVELRLEDGLPVWRWRVGAFLIERRVWMSHRANTTWVRYRLLEGDARLRLRLHPAVHFRNHDAPVSDTLVLPYTFSAAGERWELAGPDRALPALKLRLVGERRALTLETRPVPQVLYPTEETRGYPSEGRLFSPGHLRVDLARGADATLVASTDAWETIDALDPDAAFAAERERRRRLVAVAAPAAPAVDTRDEFAAELTLAADQFIITPAGRVEERTRARAAGDEPRTVIAGYHWFTDWGRDTMISLDGLSLCTGRVHEAGEILRTFAQYVRDGLIPNYFPDGQNQGLYHTADATLWYFHAIDRYLAASDDHQTLALLLPTLREIVAHHLAGTRFGIGVDPADGLLRQGADGYQLTWMDAKVDGWVVTPRRGKAVEINALWYNALRNLERWLRESGDETAAATLAGHAERAQASFNARFWCAARGWLYDVVDGEHGDDDACRPNQIFAIALPSPILARARWQPVVEVVRQKLLTPVGLRSLAPDHPDYKPRYFGDLRARDAAYHQGTVWSWLIGPFVDAWLRVHPDDRAGARALLDGFAGHQHDACVGSIAEIFDGEAPYTPRGCIAQAWGVAEVLRAWLKTSAR